MLRTDLLLGEFESVTPVYRWETGELLRTCDGRGGTGLVYVPAHEERARREVEMLALLRHPGVPECGPPIESGTGAVALHLRDAADARPLALVHDLPEAALRAGLIALLQAVNFAHSRGIVHRRIDRSVVLADPSGRFWLMGWADARPVSDAPATPVVLSETGADLRDLARAFREALLRRPWPDPDGPNVHERGPRTAAGQELIDAGVKVDRDFARVLSRLVAADPRDAYTGATDVLADLSAVDATAFDPWESIPPVGTRREVARVLRLLDNTRLPTSATIDHVASVDYVAPDGSGKSRLLAEIARVARSRDVIVLTAEGGARGSWGGVGALARQLVQLLGRGARMCVQHEETLRHLLDEHGEPNREPPRRGILLGEDRDPLTSLCTAALTDLVRIAFRDVPGLLLLDGEETLTPSARQVWRSTGEFVQAVNGGGGVLHTLLVSSSVREYPVEVGVQRVTVELKAWRQHDLEKYLACAFAAPGGARDASAAVIRITGGRPGDVVGYLRELERRDALVREGLRWRLTAPLSALPPLGGGVAEQVRRALDSCGRDAAALVECLAVARDVRLSRASVGELCDVRGPRLASAADAAVAAGLLVVDGAGWRVRTDAVAHKVTAAVPDDRRRILHREILHTLLDTSPDALDAIAVHARASFDPRAEAWTREAVARAQAEGAWATALSHLDDAAALIGNGFGGLEAELHRAELLSSLGRVGEVIESLRRRTQSEYASVEVGLKSLLLLTRAYYEARDWHGLLELAQPDTPECPAIVAEIRFIRATAMRHLGRVAMAAREARLAAAEIDGPGTPAVRLARYEYEYQVSFYALDWPGTRTALVAKLRIGAKQRDKRQVIRDLAKLGNAARYITSNGRLSQSVLCRAIGICRATNDLGGAARSSLYGALAYSCLRLEADKRAYRHFGRSNFYAIQSVAASLIVAARVRLISHGALLGRTSFADREYVRALVGDAGPAPRSAVLSSCIDLARCLLYYGFQDELEQLTRQLQSYSPSQEHRAVLVRHVSVGRMWLDEAPCDIVPAAAISTAKQLVKSLVGGNRSDAWLHAVAYCALRPEFKDDAWLTQFIARGGPLRLARSNRRSTWGPIGLALALGLWIPISYDPSLWKELLQVVRKVNGPLPVSLEWQRVLMESREFRRCGDPHRARSARDEARTQLDLLSHREYGHRGATAHARWLARLAPDIAYMDPTPGTRANPQPAYATNFADDRLIHIQPISWRKLIQGVTESESVARTIIVSRHLRELQLFGAALEVSVGRGTPVTQWTSVSPINDPINRYKILVIVGPNLWATPQIDSARAMLMRDASAARHIVTLLTVSLDTLRDSGPSQRSLVELVDGRVQQLEPICDEIGRRRRAFATLMATRNLDAKVDHRVVEEISNYTWPGGVAEMEHIVDDLASTKHNTIDMEHLHATGWRFRVNAVDERLGRDERELLKALLSQNVASVSQLANALKRPRRTVLRHLTHLMDSRHIARTGRGRATTYCLLQSGGCSPLKNPM